MRVCRRRLGWEKLLWLLGFGRQQAGRRAPGSAVATLLTLLKQSQRKTSMRHLAAVLLAAVFVTAQVALGGNEHDEEALKKLKKMISSFADEELKMASRVGDLNAARQALMSGADVNMRDPDNYNFTALIQASFRGYVHVVEELLVYGADVEAKDNISFTALASAAEIGDKSIVQALLDGGADIDARVDSNATAFYWASTMGRLDVVKYLMHKGADINVQASNGWTPLLGAVYEKQWGVVMELIKDGVDVDIADKQNVTALFMAAKECGTSQILKALVQAGADVNHRNFDGITPLGAAAFYGIEDNAETLLSLGADASLPDFDGNLPIDHLCACARSVDASCGCGACELDAEHDR